MYPQLFAGIILKVPFIDLINIMLQPDLPLTIHEQEEWGNAFDKQEFEKMLSYSPYENLKPGVSYPHTYATAGLCHRVCITFCKR